MKPEAMREPTARSHPFTRFEAHPFEGGDTARVCAFCGEHRDHIRHHPTRIRAACLLHGIDPATLLPPRRGQDAA